MTSSRLSFREKVTPTVLPTFKPGCTTLKKHMLHFLDNHDEQRLASPEFAGSGSNGRSLMVLSATISTSPVMIYFGQENGEPGNEDAGFGKRSRTSIFDYIGVPTHQLDEQREV
jgi:hypothetical protein